MRMGRGGRRWYWFQCGKPRSICNRRTDAPSRTFESRVAASMSCRRLGQQRRRRSCFCDALPGRFSHFLEGARLDLPDAFARHVELSREGFQRQRFVDQMSCLEDATFAAVAYVACVDDRPMLAIFLVLFDDDGFRRGGLIDQVGLPFTPFPFVMHPPIVSSFAPTSPHPAH